MHVASTVKTIQCLLYDSTVLSPTVRSKKFGNSITQYSLVAKFCSYNKFCNVLFSLRKLMLHWTQNTILEGMYNYNNHTDKCLLQLPHFAVTKSG